MNLSDAKAEVAFNWSIRAVRGGMAGLTAMVLCSAQQHFIYPILTMGFVFFVFSMIDRVWRYAAGALCLLLTMVILPPPLFINIGAWIERLVKG